MIRNTILGMSLFVLSAGSAIAGPAKHHTNAPRVVAEGAAPAADTTAPAAGKAPKAKKAAKDKGAAKTESTKEIKPVAPATAAPTAPAMK